MLVNTCMKFHEDTLNGFKVTERTRFCLRNCYLQSSKGHNSKSINIRVMVLAFCTYSHVALHLCKVSWKYLKTVFWVTERTRFCDRRTDGRTDPGKNNMSPNPKGGRHNNLLDDEKVSSKEQSFSTYRYLQQQLYRKGSFYFIFFISYFFLTQCDVKTEENIFW